jgi:hypothetical protein
MMTGAERVTPEVDWNEESCGFEVNVEHGRKEVKNEQCLV